MHGYRWLTVAFVLIAPIASNASDLPECKARGTLRILIARDEQPEMFNLEDAGDPGFEREVLEGFARLHRLKLAPLVVKTYAARIPALQRDEGDLIMGVISTAERAKIVALGPEVLPIRHVIVSLRPHPPVMTIDAYRNQRVGVLKDTTMAKLTAEAGVPSAQTTTFGTLNEVIQALKAGQVTATTLTLYDLRLVQKRNPDLQAGGLLGEASSDCWAMRKEDTALVEAVRSYVDAFRKSASWNRLVVKYFGKDTLEVLGRGAPR